MKKKLITITVVLLSVIFLFAASCRDVTITDASVTSAKSGEAEETDEASGATDSAEEPNPVRVITAEEAKTMMDTLESYIIVDVREQSEFNAGHIEGAVLVPVGSIEELAPELLPDKDQILLLYCRSGNRSAQAAAKLRDMGYTNIYDFGGIRDWTYETVTVD
ncbi:MAG: rhodanese-like domain-containing protein [Oscillospiraceae bacterium]|nr:rhodanese-like domain-containing protein [Oscillospiraceae bacterium]